MNPKSNKKLLLGAGSYITITWKGFFTQPHVLLSSIVELRGVSWCSRINHCWLAIQCKPRKIEVPVRLKFSF